MSEQPNPAAEAEPRIGVPYTDLRAGGPVPAWPVDPATMAGRCFDVVFAVDKSVSVYYAALLAEQRQTDALRLLDDQSDAVRQALSYLHREASYGKDPGLPEYFASDGLRAVCLLHDAAESHPDQPPHVHTHVFVDPDVTATRLGRAVPLDKRGFERSLEAAAAIYLSAVAGGLQRTHGVRFVAHTEDPDRRIIEGITDAEMRTFGGRSCHPIAVRRQYDVTKTRLESGLERM